ncbi:MAG: hypothetical protein J7599_03435 [Niabella sp.]|nr:hypothetical protein [Niabella sp.]
MTEQDPHSIFETDPDPELDRQLLALSRWTRLITVIGFGMGAFVVAMMLVSGAVILKSLESILPVKAEGTYGALIVVFFIFFFITATVLYFLYKAASNIKAGVLQKNTTLLAEGFSNFHRFFIAMAILSGISLLANISTLFQ